MPHSFVELETGDQFYFENAYDAFKYAKIQEGAHKNSVAYVAIGRDYVEGEEVDLEEATKVSVYRGQQLRLMIRSIDATTQWLRTQVEEQKNAQESTEDDSGSP